MRFLSVPSNLRPSQFAIHKECSQGRCLKGR
jgi:hypothetical protein